MDEIKKEKQERLERIARKRAADERIMAMRKEKNATDEDVEQARYEGMKEKYGEFLK